MSGNNLSLDVQFRYICQWFNEWSELQREDFVPVLVNYCIKNGQDVYMNGVSNDLENSGCSLKPLSLFQCRIKLFKDWIPKWNDDMKSKLRERIHEIDPKIGDKIKEELSTVLNGNGNCNANENDNSLSSSSSLDNNKDNEQLPNAIINDDEEIEHIEQLLENDELNLGIDNDEQENNNDLNQQNHVEQQDDIIAVEPVVEANDET